MTLNSFFRKTKTNSQKITFTETIAVRKNYTSNGIENEILHNAGENSV
jgi:hypothetical protein